MIRSMIIVCLFAPTVAAQSDVTPELHLPALLAATDGRAIESSDTWSGVRRAELLELFKENVYGRVPEPLYRTTTTVHEEDRAALGGKAIRKQAIVKVAGDRGKLAIDVLLYLPASADTKPAPVFLLLNFGGNHTVHSDPAIRLPTSYLPDDQQPAEKFRGAKSSRYPIDAVLSRGYGVATAYCGDIDPDFDDGFQNGVHAVLEDPASRHADSWGTVAAWAWGLSRIMDYVASDEDVDAQHVAVLGHSRLGKTALWAGAQDQRFAMVISNNSGCTGAALARRKHGERVKAINDRFPHWFCENYRRYNDAEDQLPVDQHMLIALAAPRPIYVASASQDDWADPTGEFLSLAHASPAYELFGLRGIAADTMPPANAPLMTDRMGYHLREGKHDLTEYDWQRYMDFADRMWSK